MYLHGNLLQVVERIKELADNDDRLHAQVHQEGHCCQSQQCRQARHTDETLYLLANSQTVVTAGVEAGLLKEGSQELGHCDGCPDHHQRQTQKPLEQFDLVSTHHRRSYHHHINRNEESCQPEAALDKKPGSIGTQRTTGIGEFAVFVEYLTVTGRFYQALVGFSSHKERDESPDEIACNDQQ